MKKIVRLAVSCSFIGLGACTTAQIAVPPNLAAGAEQLQITGMGFGERGRFALASSSGTFFRQALSSRHRDFRLSPERVTTFSGDSGFEVQGPDFTGFVAASCNHFEREAGTRTYSMTVAPFQYRCRFMRNGQLLPDELVLHVAPRAVGPLTGETRIGRVTIGGRQIDIEPIHHSPGLEIPTSEPLGYRFVSAGGDIGAVDLNGERKTIYAPRTSADREAVLMASLALSVLWKS